MSWVCRQCTFAHGELDNISFLQCKMCAAQRETPQLAQHSAKRASAASKATAVVFKATAPEVKGARKAAARPQLDKALAPSKNAGSSSHPAKKPKKGHAGAATGGQGRGDVDVEKITRVELAKGHSQCGWCDTEINKGAPRVVRKVYHAAGNFQRSNGNSGYNNGGVMDLFLHPQCAFHAKQQKAPRKVVRCQDCDEQMQKGQWGFCSMLGLAGERCTKSKRDPTWFCPACLKHFFEQETHTELLRGQISAASNLDAPVSWLPADRTSPFNARPTGGPNRALPTDEEARARLRAAFSPLEPEDTAVELHTALQLVIKGALLKDAPNAPTKEALRSGSIPGV